MGFEKNNNIMSGKGENEKVDWITVNGSHIPIKDGETPKQAIKNHFGNKTKVKDRSSIKKSFEENVDDILNGTYRDTHLTLCETTPKILQEIGVPNKPILITSKHAYLIINEYGKYKGVNDHYHNLGKELFLHIPQHLECPMFTFRNNKTKNEIVAVISAVDKNKNPVIVPIKLDATGSKDFIIVDVNLVKSIYGKNNLQNYIDANVKEEDMLSVENKKIRSLNSN